MAFHITHRLGSMTSNPPLSAFGPLLNELKHDPEDREHCSVSVTHESEWCLSAFGDGYVAWENLEVGLPRHMNGVPEEKLLRLWEALSKGELELIESEPWLPGY